MATGRRRQCIGRVGSHDAHPDETEVSRAHLEGDQSAHQPHGPGPDQSPGAHRRRIRCVPPRYARAAPTIGARRTAAHRGNGPATALLLFSTSETRGRGRQLRVSLPAWILVGPSIRAMAVSAMWALPSLSCLTVVKSQSPRPSFCATTRAGATTGSRTGTAPGPAASHWQIREAALTSSTRTRECSACPMGVRASSWRRAVTLQSALLGLVQRPLPRSEVCSPTDALGRTARNADTMRSWSVCGRPRRGDGSRS